jgi:hypothetical protein
LKVFSSKLPIVNGASVFCCLTFETQEDRQRFEHPGNWRGEAMTGEALRPYKTLRSTQYPGEESAPLGDRQGIGFRIDPMVLSQRALDALVPMIGPSVQQVPLEFAEGDYVAINIIRVIDSMDLKNSEVDFYRVDGSFKGIKRYAFKPEVLEHEWIFKIPQAPWLAFVTDRFVDAVAEAGLTGFEFEELWCSELMITR